METAPPAVMPNAWRGLRSLAPRLLLALSLAAVVGLGSRWLLSHRPHVASYAREDYERALQKLAAAEMDLERYYALPDAAKTAVYFGTLDQAEACGRQLLEMAGEWKEPGDWNYGNAIHDGHEVLGLVALRRGDIAEANRQLLLAGETPGSPQLDTFGPNMLLAKELLERGQTSTVLAYFEACRRFWENHRDRLDRWIKEALEGRDPDFGANLVF